MALIPSTSSTPHHRSKPKGASIKLSQQKSHASSISLRQRWIKQDDLKLMRAVLDASVNKKKLLDKGKYKAKHAQTNWSIVASKFPGRCQVDCRKRWMQVKNVTRSTGHNMWSQSEDKMIIKLHRQHGNK